MRKSFILVIVMGTVLLVVGLAMATIYLEMQQVRIIEHKMRRTEALFNAQAAMVYAYFELIHGHDPSGNNINLAGLHYPVDISVTAPNSSGIRTVQITVSYH